MTFKALIAGAALAAMTAPAQADVTHIFYMEASDFVLYAGPGGVPPSDVTISLIVKFDPSKAIFATTSGLTINAFSLPFKTEYAYSMLTDTLVFGTDPSPAACGVDADTWCAFVGNGSQSSPVLKSFSVSSDNGTVWLAQDLQLNNGVASSAPEPSTWALMALGFGAMAVRVLRGRKRGRRLGAVGS